MPWPTVLGVTGRRQLGREAVGASGLGEGSGGTRARGGGHRRSGRLGRAGVG